MAVWVEAVVAAPLWAFTHLDTEGEGMGQRTQTGYLFILNVLFRPALMVVGFLLGSMMVWILTTYVMNLFPTIIANASADSWTGLIKIVGYLAAFVVILQTIVSLSFGMIRFVPDQVLGWLGGNMQNQIGAHAEDTVGGAAKNDMAARGSVSGAASQASQAKKQREADSKQELASGQANKDRKDDRNFKAGALRQMRKMSQGGAPGIPGIGGGNID